MIAKRLASVVLAVALIAGAWYARDRIDADNDDGGGVNAGVLVCASELESVCRSVVGRELVVVQQDAGATVDGLSQPGAEPALWLTFDGFPQMLNVAREQAGAEPVAYTAIGLASSPIAAVVRNAWADQLTNACGNPIDLGCVGAQSELRPAVSPIDTGIGLLSVSAAVAARAGDVISFDDPELLTWARALQRANDRLGLTAGTAVATMQTKPNIKVALGVEAEVAEARREEFRILYAAPMVHAQVVLLQPAGFDIPDDLADDLAAALTAQGWVGLVDESGALPAAPSMLAIRQWWSELS